MKLSNSKNKCLCEKFFFNKLLMLSGNGTNKAQNYGQPYDEMY